MKKRLDQLLLDRGLAQSREKARALVMAGAVAVNGLVADKPGLAVDEDSSIDVQAGPRYVSRGGVKLESALSYFALDVDGKVAIDLGASTGGFTDCLLQHGAARVYAVDVGYGQLDWRLRSDPRVVVMERTNARYLESLPELADLATMDLSFISLRLVVPPVARLLREGGAIVALVKPQFEAGKGQVGKGGVVRDPAVHRTVLSALVEWGDEGGYGFRDLTVSPIRGPAGNVEFLALIIPGEVASQHIASRIDQVLAQVSGI